MAFNEDSSASGHDEPWIQWFCGLKGHEMFCEVERSYIEDGFNLYGLRACVSNFSDCLDLILDRIGPDDSDDSHLTQSACTLYGLIHARYIITAHGLDAMYNKYAAKDFGTCPLVQCHAQNVLPVGLKDEMGADTAKLFCPKCQEVYHAPPVRSRANSNGVDGAAFGTTFPHLFLMTFSNLVPDPLPVETSYIPRVFGFRLHKSAGQQQQHRTITSDSANADNLANNNNTTVAKTGNGATQNNDNKKGGEQPKNLPEQKAAEPANRDLTEDDEESATNVGKQQAAQENAANNLSVLEDDDPNKQSKKAGAKRTARKEEESPAANGNKPNPPAFLMETPTKRRRRNNSTT